MPLLELMILSLTQAITEFLPVSSSGHLIILSELTDIDSSLAVDVMLHWGTLLALVIYYRKKLISIAREIIVKRRSKLFVNLIISSLPAIVIGIVLKDAIEGDIRSVGVVITMLLLVGLIMVGEKWLLPKTASRTVDNLDAKSALAIGVAQSVSLIPGTSRSGASIIGGRLMGLSNKEAADYAFLIGIPVIFGAGLKVLAETEAREAITAYPFDMFFGMAIAAIFGLLAISLALKVLKRVGLKWFGVYRIALALLLLLVVV